MSALMTSMCVYRNIRHLTGILGCQRKHSLCNRTQNSCKKLHDVLKTDYRLLLCQLQVCHFASQGSGSKKPDVMNLAEEIGQKIDQQQNEGEKKSNQNSDKDADKDTNDEGKDEKKTWKYFFTQHGYKFLLGSLLGSSVCLIMEWGAPIKDAEGMSIEDEFSELNVIEAYCRRTYKEVFHQVQVTREPSRPKLLPDPLTYPYIQPKYTVVIELLDILVHPDWSFDSGWRFIRRPGIAHFLKSIGPPTFEIVIYTKEQGMTADPLITKFDPENYVMYRLYRDATRYEGGIHIKDLNYLNRDLSKVIFIDWDKKAGVMNPENMLSLKRWKGEQKDTTLGELASFIQAIAQSDVDDVRPVLKYYSQFDDPLKKFEENRRLQLEEQERQKQLMVQKDKQNLTKKFAKLF